MGVASTRDINLLVPPAGVGEGVLADGWQENTAQGPVVELIELSNRMRVQAPVGDGS
jgi:hypothetical protein